MIHLTRTRVRYGETDQMGVVHHANYLHYFEIGRTEMIRDAGLVYAELEREGLRLPVVEVGARFLLPARYDDVLVVRTRVSEVTAVRIRFEYTVHREGDERLLAEGHTVLASVSPEGRPRRLPIAVREALGGAS
jgi:acyl-CoA thioester hydrolase